MMLKDEAQDLIEGWGAHYIPLILALGILTAFLLGATDFFTGSELSFSIFYLLPISAVTILSGKRYIGIILSIVSASLWFAADALAGTHYSHGLIPYWNTFVRLGYFLLHTLLLSLLIRRFREEKRMGLLDDLTQSAN